MSAQMYRKLTASKWRLINALQSFVELYILSAFPHVKVTTSGGKNAFVRARDQVRSLNQRSVHRERENNRARGRNKIGASSFKGRLVGWPVAGRSQITKLRNQINRDVTPRAGPLPTNYHYGKTCIINLY